jgi:GntR family transcriptional regulator
MSPPIIQIDPRLPEPVFRQIADAIRTLIVERKLEPGDKLPTVRELAVDLIVHHNTVALAYRELAAEGWLELRRGRGAVVLERGRRKPDPGTLALFGKRLRELVAKAQSEGLDMKAISGIMGDIVQAEREEFE